KPSTAKFRQHATLRAIKYKAILPVSDLEANGSIFQERQQHQQILALERIDHAFLVEDPVVQILDDVERAHVHSYDARFPRMLRRCGLKLGSCAHAHHQNGRPSSKRSSDPAGSSVLSSP